MRKTDLYLAVLTGLGLASPLYAQQTGSENQAQEIQEIMVFSPNRTYANSAVNSDMLNQVNSAASVLGTIDYLPGVLVNEGDAFGGDDWSTSVTIRGFQVSLDEQQLGMTIDGIPNGNSNYGGGSKANRFVDTANLRGVDVVQGTSDIASWSNEALGGSMDFMTRDPDNESGVTTEATVGDYDARKYYVRYDTGEILPNTFAWLSLSSSDLNAWIDESGETNRDHLAAKVRGDYGPFTLTGYLSYDDTHEDNYQRVTPGQFAADPTWDRLSGNWTGIPHIDQNFRRGWSTLRENVLGYVRLEYDAGPIDLNGAIYRHENEGRGDWLPPYVVDLRDDGPGAPQSEVVPGGDAFLGGSSLGLIKFVNAAGEALEPIPGCESSLTFPFGGAGSEFDPACHEAGAIPVGSYRHTHYYKSRDGMTVEFDWTAEGDGFSNTLRGGLWYEDYLREESRDWHKIIDSRAGFNFDNRAYWQQYNRSFPQETLTYYLEDSLTLGPATVNLGLKQYLVDLERADLQDDGRLTATLESDSDVLLSGGVVYQTPLAGLEVFVGYAESFSSIKDVVLEANQSSLETVEPETATNKDLGIRYADSRILASLTYYDIEFENRITFIPEGTVAGIDFLNESEGAFINVGGIEASGIEAALQLNLNELFNIYFSYTDNDASYLGTGSPEANTLLGVFPGNTVFGSAEEMFVTSTNWASGNFSAGLSYKHVGKRWLDAANTQRLDDYQVADLYVGVDLDDYIQGLRDVSLQFNVTNLTDKSYIGSVAGGWGGWIAPPRTVTASISVGF